MHLLIIAVWYHANLGIYTTFQMIQLNITFQTRTTFSDPQIYNSGKTKTDFSEVIRPIYVSASSADLFEETN